MSILDSTYFIGDTSIWLVDEDPQIVSVSPKSKAGDLIYYQVAEHAPLTLYVKTSDGDTTDAQRLIVRDMPASATDPLATDDLTKGYGFGSSWYNTVSGDLFTYVSGVPFAAVWKKITT